MKPISWQDLSRLPLKGKKVRIVADNPLAIAVGAIPYDAVINYVSLAGQEFRIFGHEQENPQIIVPICATLTTQVDQPVLTGNTVTFDIGNLSKATIFLDSGSNDEEITLTA
jgi:hypothetical protein